MASEYIHGTRPGEQRRLSRLNDMLNEESLRMLGLRGGERVLDVGSGLGQLARAMARAAGDGGAVVGIERSPEQLQEAARQAAADGEADLVEFRRGDADAFPLGEAEWGTFDVVHARFLLEHVRRPESVVRSMIRAARPGGRIVLEDDDHDVLRLWPEPEGVAALWSALQESYRRLGCDPHVGRRLVALLHEAGGLPVGNRWLFFGSCSGDPLFEPMVLNLADILDGTRDAFLSAGLLSEDALDAALRALRSWRHRPDAAVWYARAWAEGRRPGE